MICDLLLQHSILTLAAEARRANTNLLCDDVQVCVRLLKVILAGWTFLEEANVNVLNMSQDKRAARSLVAQALGSALPCTAPRGPFGPGSQKRVTKRVPKEEPERVRPGVSKESERQVLDSFRTLLRLLGALFRHFWGPAPGWSFGTLF